MIAFDDCPAVTINENDLIGAALTCPISCSNMKLRTVILSTIPEPTQITKLLSQKTMVRKNKGVITRAT